MPDSPVERTSLLLVHLRGDLYVLDSPSPPDDVAFHYDNQPRDSFRFDDIADSLDDLGWEIETVQDDGVERRLFLKRHASLRPGCAGASVQVEEASA